MTPLRLHRRHTLVLAAAAACGVANAQTPAAPIRIALIEGLSGPFANAGEAVFRNLLWATERVNDRGGVKVGSASRRLEIVRFDSEGNTEKALSLLRSATDQGIGFVARATARPPRRR